jgi:hypothetical protein
MRHFDMADIGWIDPIKGEETSSKKMSEASTRLLAMAKTGIVDARLCRWLANALDKSSQSPIVLEAKFRIANRPRRGFLPKNWGEMVQEFDRLTNGNEARQPLTRKRALYEMSQKFNVSIRTVETSLATMRIALECLEQIRPDDSEIEELLHQAGQEARAERFLAGLDDSATNSSS